MHAGGLDLAGPVGARDVAPPVLPSRRLDRVGILIPNRTGACRASGSRRKISRYFAARCSACMCPFNASWPAFRLTTHDSGSVWLAGPSPYSSFICSYENRGPSR